MQIIFSYYLILASLLLVSGFKSLPHSNRLSSKLFNKIKVKLLVDVKGQGHKGEVISVSPALYTNVLSRNKQAKMVTDEEIEQENKEKLAKEATILTRANEIGLKIENLKGSSSIIIYKKVGTNGQLFGSVTKKNIIENLTTLVSDLTALDEKHTHISIISIKTLSTEGKGEEVDEIRKAGIYQVIIQIHPKVTSSFQVEIKADK